MPPVLACQSLSCRRTFWNESGPAHFLDATADFDAGRLHAIRGADPSAPTLLLNVLGLLEPQDSGTVSVAGINTGALAPDELCQLRNEAFGFLFKHSCLLPSFTVAENVAMPLFRICGGDARNARARTLEVLEFCGIPDLEETLTARLDPATRTRAALARALVHRPRILVAMAPRHGKEILALCCRAAREFNLCVLWAADTDGCDGADRIIELRDGRVVVSP